MGYKRLMRKIAKFILASQPQTFVNVEIAQVNYGNILKNKKIVITGGGRGLGYSMAKKFISEGANVIIAGRNKDTLEKAQEELGNQCNFVVYDVADVQMVNIFLQQCKDIFGGEIDCLVSNAGISLHENHFTNVTPDGFDKQFNTNFRGNYFLCKGFLEQKIDEKSNNAHLLLISSETANQAYDIPYGLTKAAMNSLVEAFSRRVYQNGIRVNAIAPGVTLSDMTKSYAEAYNGNMSFDCAAGRVFLPEEVAELACFLLSDVSRCISGEIIHTNAGNHLKPFWEN